MDDRFLVVFPRGFIGRANSGLNKETNNATMADKIEAIRLNNMNREPYSEVYNIHVTDMYEAMIGQQLAHDKLTFIKAVITEAYRNLGERDFSDFVGLQRNSRYFTRQHQDFILDTMKFIQCGKRDTSTRTWELVLRRKLIDDVQSVHKHPTYDKRVSEFFSSPAADGKPLTGSMHRIISQWMSHRNGHEDLLLTLNLLFGKEFNK